jgi:hypothetical protein
VRVGTGGGSLTGQETLRLIEVQGTLVPFAPVMCVGFSGGFGMKSSLNANFDVTSRYHSSTVRKNVFPLAHLCNGLFSTVNACERRNSDAYSSKKCCESIKFRTSEVL